MHAQQEIDVMAEALRAQGLTWSQTNFAVSLVRNAAAAERERLIPEREALGLLLCSVADNLGDMPINDEWAASTSRKAFEMLERNDYFRADEKA